MDVPCPKHYRVACTRNKCQARPCGNGGTCVNGYDVNKGFTCFCAEGTTGDTCDEDIDECDSNPCLNGGTCVNEMNKYSCNCEQHYVGDNCETEDICRSDPCLYGGTCLNGNHFNNGYDCSCVEGTGGDNCETDTANDCDPDPCQNGATCHDGILNYTCTCAAGYEGDSCEIDIDECASNPCQHGGSCMDHPNYYTCNCEEDYTGTHCETDMCSLTHAGGIDIIFAMDASKSLTTSGFLRQKEYIADFIAQFPVGPNETQVGVVTYSYQPTINFHLSSHSNNVSLLAAINDMEFLGGASYLGKALGIVREEMLTTENGARASSTKYLVVLTDGLFSNFTDARIQASFLRQNGVTIFAVCFGKSIYHGELIELTSNFRHVFSPFNKDGVNAILKRNVMETCPDCYWNTSDVAVGMEMSEDTTQKHLTDRLQALRELLSKTTVRLDGVRISYTTYGPIVKKIFDFNVYDQNGKAISAIQKTAYEPVGHANLSMVLDYFLGEGFTESRGGRHGFRKVLILLTNGFFADSAKVSEKARALREAGVILVTISTGRDVNVTSLIDLTSDPSFTFIVGEEVFIPNSVLNVLNGIMKYEVCQFD